MDMVKTRLNTDNHIHITKQRSNQSVSTLIRLHAGIEVLTYEIKFFSLPIPVIKTQYLSTNNKPALRINKRVHDLKEKRFA